MTTNFDQKTAKIYQFPQNRSKAGMSGKSGSASFGANSPKNWAFTEHGSAWYHQEAISDADPTRKPDRR